MSRRAVLLVLLLVSGAWFPRCAFAATAYFSPSSGTFSGETMSVDILVDTKNIAVNNAEMVVRFPNDLLEIVSTSASDSVFSLWVGAPKFSNETGTLSFTAGIPTPGFTGDAGKILSVVFRIKGRGSASLVFSSVIIRANDGYGSNVFQSGSRATFDLASERTGFPSDTLGGVPVPPVFTDYPTELEAGAQLIVQGTAAPEQTVDIWLQKDKEDQQGFFVESTKDGKFRFSPEKRVESGIYRLWAETTNAQGAKSQPTEKIIIPVAHKSIDSRVAIFVGAALIFLFALWYAWRASVLSRRRLRKETLEAESSLHNAFGSLRENRERLEMFEAARKKRKLTQEEERIVTWLKKDLDSVEKNVQKEIKDIEEEIK